LININRERLLDSFLSFTRLPGPSLNEKAVADKVLSQLASLNVPATLDQAGSKVGGTTGNVIGRLEPSRPDLDWILLAAHMDTVAQSGVEPVVDGDIVRSPGDTILGADDRAAIAAVLEAVRSVLEANALHLGVELIFTIGEETGLLGSKSLDIQTLRSHMAFVVDSSGPPGRIIKSAPFHNRITWKIHGKAAHAGVAPESGINAIHAASLGIARMNLGRIDEETTSNLGVIHGGKATNIVCDYVEIKGEVRSRDKKKLAQQTSHLIDAMRQGAESVGARVTEDVVLEYEGFDLAEDHPVVAAAVRACNRCGLVPELVASGGGSDANVLNAQGIPAVNLAVGYVNPHSADERIAIADLQALTCLLVELISPRDLM